MARSRTQHGPAPADYNFDEDGPTRSDTAVHATYIARDLPRQLRELLRSQAAALAVDGRQLAVVGRMAWATDCTALAALGKHARGGVCLVVNKETWLRADDYASLSTALSLDELFLSQHVVPPSYGTAVPPRAVWCAGAVNTEQAISFPRMHCKELVLCYRSAPTPEQPARGLQPYAVWTGSYNLTVTARSSVESAMVLWSQEIATMAYRQFLSVLARGEPLPDPTHPVALASSPTLCVGE